MHNSQNQEIRKYNCLDSSCSINCVITFDYTADSEMKLFEPIFRDDLGCNNFINSVFRVESPDQIDHVFSLLENQAKSEDLMPILLFDGHGHKNGLDFSPLYLASNRESVSVPKISENERFYQWGRLYNRVKKLNQLCANNLIICFGSGYSSEFQSCSIDFLDSSPYYYSVAPIGKAIAGELKRDYIRFFSRMLDEGDFDLARQSFGHTKYHRLHPETLMMLVFSSLNREFSGRRLLRQREDALTKFLKHYQVTIPVSKSKYRRDFNQYVRNKDELFRKYKSRFLLSDDPRNQNRFRYTAADVIAQIEPWGAI